MSSIWLRVESHMDVGVLGVFQNWHKDLSDERMFMHELQLLERCDEAAPMIIKGLETGFVEGDGKHYKQPRVDVRPKPTRGIRERLYCVAMSPDSVDVAAQLGATMTSFIQHDISTHAPEILRYKKLFKEHHGREAPPPVLTDFLYCDTDMVEAERVSKEYIAQYFLSVVKHYEFAGTHFDQTKGYKSYGEGAALIHQFGLDAAADAYRNAQSWGTPEKIPANYARWRDLIGDFALNAVFSYVGLPFAQAEHSLRLFAAEVMPKLRQMMDAPARAKVA